MSFICNKHPATAGHAFKPGTSRTMVHTDESLLTLLLTSPGAQHILCGAAEYALLQETLPDKHACVCPRLCRAGDCRRAG